jgi:hypothetical protein
VFDVFLGDRIYGDHAGDAYGTYTIPSVGGLQEFYNKRGTYAAPRASMKMTASFLFSSIFTLMTIGIGRTRMTTSAMAPVN